MIQIDQRFQQIEKYRTPQLKKKKALSLHLEPKLRITANKIKKFGDPFQYSILSTTNRFSIKEDFSPQENTIHRFNNPKDLESYQQELSTLKQELHSSVQQLRLVKTQNATLEKEISRLEQIIRSNVNPPSLKQSIVQDNHVLVQTMRFKYKEMKNQLEQRSSDLAETKKKIKFTKITEMEIEKTMYQEECDRLRRYLDEFERLHLLLLGKMEVIEENKKYIKIEHSIFQNLVLDNQTLYDSLVQQQKINDKLCENYFKLDSKNVKQSQEKDKLNTSLKEKDIEISKLWKSIKNMEQEIQKLQNLRKSKTFTEYDQNIIKEKDQEIQNLKISLHSAQDQINDLKKLLTNTSWTNITREKESIDQKQKQLLMSLNEKNEIPDIFIHHFSPQINSENKESFMKDQEKKNNYSKLNMRLRKVIGILKKQEDSFNDEQFDSLKVTSFDNTLEVQQKMLYSN